MKRSEMVQNIKQVLSQERSSMLGAEKILILIEEAGMLPPPKETDVINSRLMYVYYNEDSIEANDDSKLDRQASKLWDKE